MNPPLKFRDLPASFEQASWLADEVIPHEAAVRGYLRNRFPSADVEEVVQESYLKLLKARAAGRISSTKAYFFSIARNTAINLFHRKRIYSETPVSELPAWRVLDNGPDAVASIDAAERIEIVTEALNQLPPRCRDVLRFAVLHGYSNAEIARELGIAENTVRVHLGRGLKKCARYLREHGET